MGSADNDEPGVPLPVVDAERNRSPQGQAGKVVIPNVVSLASPGSARVLESTDQFFLLGVDADRRIPLVFMASPQVGDVAKLAIAVRFVSAGQALAIGSQREFLGREQSRDRVGADRDPLPSQRLGQPSGGLVSPTQTVDRIAGGRILDQIPQSLHNGGRFFSMRGRPPPFLRTRPATGPRPVRSSVMPRAMVVRLRPVMAATNRMPP
jgi:hypothetical protein